MRLIGDLLIEIYIKEGYQILEIDENTYNNYKSLIEQFYSIETAEDGSSQVSVDGDGVAAIQNLFKISNGYLQFTIKEFKSLLFCLKRLIELRDKFVLYFSFFFRWLISLKRF